jgi:hypothetical protein
MAWRFAQSQTPEIQTDSNGIKRLPAGKGDNLRLNVGFMGK